MQKWILKFLLFFSSALIFSESQFKIEYINNQYKYIELSDFAVEKSEFTMFKYLLELSLSRDKEPKYLIMDYDDNNHITTYKIFDINEELIAELRIVERFNNQDDL